MISVALALVVAFLLELKHPVLRTAAQMERETGLAPVASIPVLKTKSSRLRGDTLFALLWPLSRQGRR